MSSESFNSMKSVVSVSGGVPAGTYDGKFVKAELLPEQEADPMTGKGGRQYAAVRFVWEITDAEYRGKQVNTETTTLTGVNSGYYRVGCWLLNKKPSPGEGMDLTPCVGKSYILTVGSKKPGGSWMEVTNAISLTR